MRINKLIDLAKTGNAGVDIVAIEKLGELYGAGAFDMLNNLMPTILSDESISGGQWATPVGGPCFPSPGTGDFPPYFTTSDITTFIELTVAGSGTVEFEGFTPAQLANFAIIPEI